MRSDQNKNKIDNDIQKSFDISLTNENLKNISINLGEVSIDRLLKDGTLKDISIIGTIVNLINLGANIKDKLFLKKIISFLNEIKDVAKEERKEIINKIDNSKKYRIKVGEKLLYIIDSCSDYENSEMVARLFKKFIEDKISYDDFLRSSNAIERITNFDLKWFLKNDHRFFRIENVPGNLISSGLFDLQDIPVNVNVVKKSYDDIKMEDFRPNGDYKAEIDGGGISVSLSDIGEIIMETFNPEYKKPRIVNF